MSPRPSETPATISHADTLLGDVGSAEGRTLAAPHEPSSGPSRVDVAAAEIREAAFEARYDLRRVLGAGGMGEVRLYRDHRIGREIAVKVMHSGTAASGTALERFVREARIQGQLEHPAVVPVYDLGASADGAAYFSMKRVRGRALDEIIRLLATNDEATRARYSRRKLLSAFATVCLSVDFAHTRGVLHRDIKPANIMLGDFGEVHLLDWGVARILGAVEPTDDLPAIEATDAGSDTASTRAGAIVGTPGYMAPEQARGQHELLDRRTDVYALGAVLFELLALEPLHTGATATERLVSTLEGCDPRPSHRAPTAEIPPELDDICARVLEAERDARFATAGALAEAVERFLDGDRDLERRRSLAEQHLARARDAAARARTDPATAHQDRGEAMREVTRALAFDPENKPAAALLAQLFVDVPESMPAAAERELAQQTLGAQKNAAGVSVARSVAALAFIPLLAWFGIRDWTPILCGMSLMAVASVANLLWWKAGGARPDHWLGRAALVLSGSAIASLSYLFGPFVLVPMLSLINSMLFGIQTDFRMKRFLVAMTPLPVILPVVLDWLGLVPLGWSFHGDHITIAARAIRFHPVWSMAFLIVSGVGPITITVAIAGRLREALAKSERRLFLHSWNLRQLARGGP